MKDDNIVQISPIVACEFWTLYGSSPDNEIQPISLIQFGNFIDQSVARYMPYFCAYKSGSVINAIGCGHLTSESLYRIRGIDIFPGSDTGLGKKIATHLFKHAGNTSARIAWSLHEVPGMEYDEGSNCWIKRLV